MNNISLNLQDKFNELLNNCKKVDGINDLVTYLDKNGFKDCPNSYKYDRSYDNGLLEHTILLAETMQWLNVNRGYGLNDCSIALVALVHDIYKLGLYTKSSNNGFSYNSGEIRIGTTTHSIIVAQQFIELSKEEIEAIYVLGYSFDDAIVNKQTVSKIIRANKLALCANIAHMMLIES